MNVSLKELGPGMVIAATGLGAGDLIAASVAGANFGYSLLWAALVGALLKFALNEGVARWQLVTGTTVLEGWYLHLPKAVSWYFILYLTIWSFVVAGALMAACGLAVHALFPTIGVAESGAAQSLIAAWLVLQGRYRTIERLMMFFIVLMLLIVLYCAWEVFPGWSTLFSQAIQSPLPKGSLWFVFGVIGGVGGSVTLLSYGYWIRERGWLGSEKLSTVRVDLLVAYVFTAVFGIAVMIISAGVDPAVMKGTDMVISVADHLGTIVGPVGRLMFLIGFWGGVFSSMLGVWQGVPYLFSDFVTQSKSLARGEKNKIDTRGIEYRGWLAGMALLPMVLLLVAKPVWLVIAYAVVGAMFMPLLAALLLILNNRGKWMREYINSWWSNLLMLVSLLLFAGLFINKISNTL